MKKLLMILTVSLFSVSSVFAKSPVYTTIFGNKAINGYDPVAYHTQNKPVKGSAEFSFKWMEANWLFSSQENLDLFKADPKKYAPQYGGYCAYAVSKGSTASTEPEAWTIYEGKLYLNYNQKIKEKWETDIPGYLAKSEKNWPGVLK